MKKLLIPVLLLALVACQAFAAESFKIKVTTWHAADHPITLGLAKFKALVEAKSNGRISVQVFPSAQLGPEDVYIDSVKKGNVEMGITGTLMGRDVPAINIGELPFLFNDWAHAKKVFLGPIGEELTAPLPEKAKVRNLVFFADGFRIISSNTDLSAFEKLKGMRLRVPNTPVYVEMTKGFGANPITMAFSEVFTAIETRVVDGQENPAATIRSSRFYEVQKGILDSKHMFSPRLLIINEALYQRMGPELQKAVDEAARESAEYQWKISEEAEVADVAFMAGEGTKIIVPDEAYKAKLRDSQKAMYAWFFEKYPESQPFFDKIRNVK